MKRKIVRATALLLSLVFVFSAFSVMPISASAAAETINIRLISYPRSGEDAAWGHSSLTLMNGWSASARSIFYAVGASDKGMQVAYCVQPGVALSTGNSNTEILPETFLDTYNNGVLNYIEIQRLLGRIMQYGYTGVVTASMSDDALAEMIATRNLVWEVIVGERDASFNHVSPSSGYNRVSETIRSDHPLRSAILAHYDRIVSSVKNHSRLPSFMRASLIAAATHEMTWDGSKYTVTLTDTNGVLSNFNFSSPTAGVSFTKSGNNLTITATNPPSSDIEIRASKTNSVCSGITFWCSDKITVKGSVQGLVMSGQEVSDPINAYVKVKVSYGTLAIVKTTQHNNGTVSGFTFEVRNSAGNLIGTYTSNSSGKIDIPNLYPGVYSVKEINLSTDFVQPATNPKSVTVNAGQTATVSFDNIKKRGIITIRKTNANPDMGGYSLAGAVFEIRDAGGTLVDTITTDGNGRAQSKILPLGVYRVREITAPYGFVLNTDTFTAVLSGTQGTGDIVYCPDVVIAEQPQVGTITITKEDVATSTRAQGDSTLNGAVFEVYAAADIKKQDGTLIYSKNQLADTIYCGSGNSATSKELPLGDYYYKEKVPPVGYTLDTRNHPITIEYQGQNVAVVRKYDTLTNKVIEGQIAFVKHTDEPDPDVEPANPQVEAPLEGAIFEVYLKSAGSYGNALPSERDLLTTDADGYAKTKLLPYGIYTVHETYAPGDVRLVDPFDVFISKDGNVYRYILSDPWFRSLVKIIKVDSETGETVPAAGVSFRVKDLSTGEWIVQHINYPTPIDIEVFETAPDGTLVMPETLKSGDYELWEVEAPYGYVLSADPVKFTIHSTQLDHTVAEVLMANNPAKGIISVEKIGNMLTGADVTDTAYGEQYTPVYDLMGLSGAEFDVIAAEDIYTGDGTLRAAEGTVVDTITTDENGYAETKQLYLGNYVVVESEAPHGFVLDKTSYPVSLVYEGQEVAVVSSQIGIGNTRQFVEIELQKVMEIPENAPEEYNAYQDVVFGLYADEDIEAVDGTVLIAEGSLIALMQIDGEGKGNAGGELPFARYHVKELVTAAGYITDETAYEVVFDYDAGGGATVELAVNSGEPIGNNLMRGSLRIIKTFEGLETPIEGVPFTVIGETVAETTVEIDAVTDENGEILLENLLVGQYTVKELESELTVGYALSPDETVIIAADEIAEMSIENNLMRGDLRIIKTFEGKETALAGVKFTVAGVSVGGIPFEGEFETDEDGCIYISDLLIGEYTVVEIESDLTAGYVLSEEQTVIVAFDKVTELQIENKLIRGNVKLVKTDSINDAKLAGAEFELIDPDGNLIGVYVTDKNGEIFIEDLPYGFSYKLVETAAPNGYKLGKVELSFDITENGETVELSASNEAIPPDNPKTGDDSNTLLWLVLAGVSAAVIAGLGIIWKYRKSRKGVNHGA